MDLTMIGKIRNETIQVLVTLQQFFFSYKLSSYPFLLIINIMIYIRITREMLDTFVSRFRYAMEYLICRGDRYVSKYNFCFKSQSIDDIAKRIVVLLLKKYIYIVYIKKNILLSFIFFLNFFFIYLIFIILYY